MTAVCFFGWNKATFAVIFQCLRRKN